MSKEWRHYEKGQEEALAKAASNIEEAPKAKYIRKSIILSWELQNSEIFWKAIFKLPLGTNPIMCYKSVHIIHKLLLEGHPSFISETYTFKSKLNQLGGLWSRQTTSYSPLISAYLRFISEKLDFHHQYENLKGDLNSELGLFSSNYDFTSAYSLCMSILELHSSLIFVSSTILGSLNKLTSPEEIECRVSAFIPIVQESRGLYYASLELLKLLHHELDLDSLADLDKIFLKQWHQLKILYNDVRSFEYLRKLVEIPELGDYPPTWLKEGKTNLPKELQRSGEKDLESSCNHEEYIAFLKREIERLKNEVNRLNTKIENLLQQRRDYDSQAEQARSRLQQLEDTNATQAKRLKELQGVEKQIETATSELNSTKTKFAQMTKMYKKLRGDHLDLLKKSADSDKFQAEKASVESKFREEAKKAENLEKEFSALKLENERLDKENTKLLQYQSNQGKLASENSSKIAELSEAHAREIEALKQKYTEDLQKSAERIEAETKKRMEAKMESERKMQEGERKKDESTAREDINGATSRCVEIIRQAIDELDGSSGGNDSASIAYTLESVHRAGAAGDHVGATLSSLIGDKQKRVQPTSFVDFTQFADAVVAMLHNSKGLTRLAEDDKLSNSILTSNKDAANASIELLLSGNYQDGCSTESQLAKVKNAKEELKSRFDKVIEATENLEDKKYTDSSKLGTILENEFNSATEAIHAASRKLQEMLEKAQQEQEGLKLDVHESILGGSKSLMDCIRLLIREASNVQSEIVKQSGGFADSSTFYSKNHMWAEGLISAAKAVGWGADVLVENANKAVSGNGKFEAISAAANNISASTTHLVTASRVKAPKHSEHQKSLEGASKNVREATKELAAISKNAAQLLKGESPTDFSNLSDHEASRVEMEQQIKILELENKLEDARNVLFSLRKERYK
ncbi:huntingtin-interacting protein 1-related protein-like isoform X2 [Zophobas morio]|uniref:huntingtin-interacting protein 1-related protein-like isoform X2 n=1 Tax=Zophobas morio TaxID=2755281 RepID=UPI0030828762